MSLSITIHSCTAPLEAQFMDKTDPYVAIECDGHKRRTTTRWDAGSYARFEETFTLPMPADKTMKLTVFDAENIGSNHPLASQSLTIEQPLDHYCLELSPKISITLSVTYAE